MANTNNSTSDRLVIGVDLDGVVYDFVNALRTWLHLETGRDLDSMPAATTWDFYSEWGLSLEEFLAHYADGVRAGHMFSVGQPMPGAIQSLDRLQRAGHELHVITARGVPGVAQSVSLAATRSWLDSHSVPHDRLDVVHDSSTKTGFDLDLLVNDAPRTYLERTAAGLATILFSQAWNAHIRARRVGSWAEFCDLVDLLSSGREHRAHV